MILAVGGAGCRRISSSSTTPLPAAASTMRRDGARQSAPRERSVARGRNEFGRFDHGACGSGSTLTEAESGYGCETAPGWVEPNTVAGATTAQDWVQSLRFGRRMSAVAYTCHPSCDQTDDRSALKPAGRQHSVRGGDLRQLPPTAYYSLRPRGAASTLHDERLVQTDRGQSPGRTENRPDQRADNQ